jgi:hypothetical protein
MLFLMNDAVLDLAASPPPPRAGAGLHPLPLSSARRLGQELYAESPLLHLLDPAKARRLAALIRAAAPELNAAHFLAPSFGCDPDEVSVRFAHVEPGVMARLNLRQDEGLLDTVATDRQVWRRLAA